MLTNRHMLAALIAASVLIISYQPAHAAPVNCARTIAKEFG